MHVPTAQVLPLLGLVRRRLDEDVSLSAIADAARRSRFDVHRAFRRVTGETTKKYTSRLRLDQAAAGLLLGTRSILDIALDSGFASHEVFSRAFLRRFGMTPRAYRARGLAGVGAREVAARHAAVIRDAGPCIGLHHLQTVERKLPMSNPVSRRNLDPRPALVIRRKVAPSEIAKTLGEVLPRIFEHAQKRGLPFGGPPFTRYLAAGPGLLTIEAGMPLAVAAAGEGDIEAITLPGGPAAIAIHRGPYDTLRDTYVVIEQWLDAEKLQAGGAPWETYVTDPADRPDPKDWETEITYPLAR